LLCGKPLSRIWVGAGDDFCSREHGNQYRLKRGMDRLLEANKISSLMRRRENPRPIAAASLSRDSAASCRGFFGAKVPPASGMRFPSPEPLSASPTLRISPASERYLPPRLPRPAGSFKPRQADSSFLRFSARKTAPVTPPRRTALPVRIPRARPALLRYHVRGTAGEHRGFGALRHAGMRAQAGFGAIAPPRIELPGAACFRKSRHPLGTEAPPSTSGAQRLPRGFGYRRPARRGALCARLPRARATVAGALAVPGRQFLYTRKILNGPAARRAIRHRISTHGLVCPSFLARMSVPGIQWPGAVRIGRRMPWNGHAPARREWGSLWHVSEPAGFPRPLRFLSAPQRGRPTPRLVALPLAPARADGAAPRVTLAPFAPQNSPFGYKEHQDK